MTTMTGWPSTPCGGSCVLSLDDDDSTDINSPFPACVLWPPPNIRTYIIMINESTALSNLDVWNVGGIEWVTSEYRCMVLVPWWCGVYGIICIVRYFVNTLGVESRMSAVYAGESCTNSTRASVPLFYLQSRWSGSFWELNDASWSFHNIKEGR